MSDSDGFLKRNGFLVAGIALPVLVVVIFVLARALPRAWVDDPIHDVLYAVRSSYGAQPHGIDCSLSVVDGRVRARWTKMENPIYQEPPRIYRLHPATGAVEDIPLPEPEGVELPGGSVDLEVPGFEGMRIDRSPRSPDGYEFHEWEGGGSGLLSELLIDRHRRARSVLRKSGRVIVLPRADDAVYGYSPVQFLGWLVPVEDAR